MNRLIRQSTRYGVVALIAIAPPLLAVHSGYAQDVAIKILVNDDPISDYDISQRERFLAYSGQ